MLEERLQKLIEQWFRYARQSEALRHRAIKREDWVSEAAMDAEHRAFCCAAAELQELIQS